MDNKEMVGGFPGHNIDPRQKDKAWILQFTKAAWDDYNKNSFKFGYNDKYNIDTIKAYAQGRQSTTKYKPLLGVDKDSDESWMNIDWSILPIVPKFRRIAVNKLMESEDDIIATPIDALAQDEMAAEFAAKKTKVMMREAMRKINPELLQSPALEPEPGEPQDLEELEMQNAFSSKHNSAMEAEMGIALVFDQNDLQDKRRTNTEELFDVGYAGYREWIDENNKIRVRTVRPDNLIVSACRNADFSDKFYAGEIVELTISDLKKVSGDQFSEDDFKDIASKMKGQYGNPNSISDFRRSNNAYGYDTNRVRVLDIEFYSTNEMVYEQRVDRRGNLIFGRAGFEDRNKVKDKFKRTSIKVIYTAKWIIGTDMMYDFGLATDMKRAKSSMSDTELSFHFRATDFYDMRAVGKMQNVMPIADAIQLAWYKLQNALAQAVPGAWSIDLGALEDVALGAGGKKMTPKELLDMFWQRNIMVYRSQNMQGQGTPNKPVEYQANASFGEVKLYWEQILNYIELIRQIMGLNELTDGSTPNSRTLTTVAKMAGQASNNALGDIEYAERRLREKLAGAVVLRLQDVVQRTDVKGYIRSLGTNTIKYFQMSPQFSLYELGVKLEQKPTAEARMRLLSMLDQYAAAGITRPEDHFLVEGASNLKQAQEILAYKVKKRLEEKQGEAMQQQQMNGQIQQQSAQVAEQSKQQTLQLEYSLKTELEKVKGEIQMQIASLKLQNESENTFVREQSKENVAHIQASSKSPTIPEEEVFQPELS